MKKKFFYIAAAPTYGREFFIKIGITDHPKNRIMALKKHDHLLDFRAVFLLDNPEYTPILECALIANFYKKRSPYPAGAGREFFRGDPTEFIAFAIKTMKKSGENYFRSL